MIFNENWYHKLFSQGHQQPSKSIMQEYSFEVSILSKSLENNKNYWYVEFHGPNELELLPTIVPGSILNLLRSKKLNLLLGNSNESFHSIIEQIYKIAIDHLKIPEECITLVSGSADILSEIKNVSTSYNRQEIKAIWSSIFEARLREYIDYRPNLNIKLQNKNYNKKFLNFNRRWRLHRPLFVALMFSKNLLDLGYISLANSDDNKNWNNVWEELIKFNSLPYNKTCPNITHLLETNKDKILELPEMYLDTDELVDNKFLPDTSSDVYYTNSYFSIISETNFYTSFDHYEKGRFLTEKIFKSVYYKHPFILISTPGSLNFFKSLGYKTFGEFINEDYDNECDDYKRIIMILHEVERLSKLNNDQLKEFIEYAQSICEYNYQHLANKNYKNNFIKLLN